MSWSLGETRALILKAARGAGMAWGIAEEASEVVIWLQKRGIPGVAAFCCYLNWYQSQKILFPSWKGLAYNTGPACPLATGTAIADGVFKLPNELDKPLNLGLVKKPVLMLPFISKLGPHDFGLFVNDYLIVPDFKGKKHRLYGDFCAPLLISEAECSIKTIAKVAQTKVIQNNKSMRIPDYCGGCIDIFNRYAKKTFAPSSDHSRTSGAGAGIQDYD